MDPDRNHEVGQIEGIRCTGSVPREEGFEVRRRHNAREALAQHGGDAVDEDFDGGRQEDSEGLPSGQFCQGGSSRP